MHVLIVKMSSMGDLIHALPALTDAQNAIPDIKFDWVVEEAFAEIPRLHATVDHVIPIALRRWRKNLWRQKQAPEWQAFLKRMRAKKYDLVIDAQASTKSAVVTRFTRGVRCGMDYHSAREILAPLFYQKTYPVNKQQHAIARQRQLFAQALGYTIPDTFPDYHIDRTRLLPAPITLPERYAVFLHSTSWITKCWPEAYWLEVIAKTNAQGFHVILPWGGTHEKARAERLALNNPMAIVPPKLKLAEAATIIVGAKAGVCVDTGLGHLTAALDVPAISLYGPTNPGFIGAVGKSQIHLCATFPCAPCRQKQCTYKGASEQQPACFTNIPPARVWGELEQLLAI
jgi:heptosyltransferase-1